MKKLWLFLLSMGAAGVLPAAPLKVVTTTPDLADIAAQVGGDAVKAESLAKGPQDPHFVEAKPSLITKLMSADLFIETGLELEVGWAPLLVQGSRNAKIQAGAPGFLDASRAVKPLDVPQNPSRAMGDVHPGGNPHYLMNPENGRLVAREIAEKLSELSPKEAPLFQKNLASFESALDEKIKEWKEAAAVFKGARYVSYHRNVAYFADYFGLVSAGEIEPKPGIPPTAQHTASLIESMKAKEVSLILTQGFYEKRAPEFLARETGAAVVVMAIGPGSVPEATTYLGALDYNVRAIARALAESKSAP